MTLSLFLDMALIVLLAVTIGYAAVLNRKLAGLRRNKAEMEKLAAVFAQATLKADDGIGRLRIDTEALRTQADKAQGLRDDLAFLLERANTAADRLEDAIRASRARTPPAAAPGSSSLSMGASLGASSGPRIVKDDAKDHGDDDGIEARSEAERELLKALRAAS